MPQRFQRKRTARWRKPEGAIYVGRPTKWGNPFTVEEYGVEKAVSLFRECMTKEFKADVKRELKGKDLLCWCNKNHSCHADILLQIANEE